MEKDTPFLLFSRLWLNWGGGLWVQPERPYVWETHRSPLWGRGHVEGWALLEVGAEGTVVLLL